MKKFFLSIIVALLISVLLVSSALAWDYVKSTASPTYVRNGPGLSYDIIDGLPAGNIYTWGGDIYYDSRGIAWYDIHYDAGYGWISSLHGNLIDTNTGGAHNNTDVSLGNGTSVRASGDVNVRTGPGTEYSKIGTLFAGQTADFTGHKKYASNGRLWYQINFYNQIGWVSSTYAAIY